MGQSSQFLLGGEGVLQPQWGPHLWAGVTAEQMRAGSLSLSTRLRLSLLTLPLDLILKIGLRSLTGLSEPQLPPLSVGDDMSFAGRL